MGVALGWRSKEKEVAVLASAISFFIMHTSIATMLELTDMAGSLPEGSVTSVTGITSLQMGMFGGVLVGLGTAALHNRFYKIQLPRILSFFGGTRFVPIICSIVYLLVGILMFYIWPVLQEGIYMLGDIVQRSGYYGTFLYGVIERALIPSGFIMSFIFRSGRRQLAVRWKLRESVCREHRISSLLSLRIPIPYASA